MTRRAWVRLDNASNIFLAARSDADPKVFRLAAEMDHDVDRERLQLALDATYDRYRLYHAVLRSGVFWYYLQDSDLRPRVTAEEQPTCAGIYQADRRRLLFRVMHHRRRIILEVFHVLSDGTGALWFLSDLVAAYTRLGDLAQTVPLQSPDGDGPIEPDLGRAAAGTRSGVDGTPLTHQLAGDSFAHYFRGRRDRTSSPGKAAFTSAAAPAALAVADHIPSTPHRGIDASRGLSRPPRRSSTKVHRVRGTRTPDNRTRAVELSMASTEVLALARAESVSPTMFLTALFFESIRRSSDGLGPSYTLAASVPVNLRQFFPSTSARNFFATVRVEHTYGKGADDLGSVCRQLDSQFRPKATPEALEKKLRRFIRFERMPALRIVPRPLKDVILKLVNWRSNRGLSVAVSNLGLARLPEPAESRVARMLFQVSAVRPQLCAMSHAGLLTISFTSPFIETGHIREFARLLTGSGVAVTLAAARVTETELAEGGP
ncbi:alcohol acetyltransferase [Microlunatus ginsengisoli]|uniref:alcohol acetyltransferase n=1 Tax=Microlunatus ginsengisoli TaxID=363863 RepID=UPI0031DBD6BF